MLGQHGHVIYDNAKKKTSQNLKNGKRVSLYDNVPFIFECFMTYNTPSSAESIEPESHQTTKMFSFFFFRQTSSKIA